MFKEKLKYLLEIILVLVILLLIFNKPSTKEKTTNVFVENSFFQIYFIDVGEADSILIKSNDEYTLVDAGNNKDGKKLVEFFKDLGIENFKYVFGTHPHEDHIGGLDYIIKEFNIENFFMPDVYVDNLTYIEILDNLDKKNIELKIPSIDDKYLLNDTELKILWIDNNKDNLNDDSIILKVTYKNNTFLLTGDASKNVELQILEKDLKSDLLKVGHHGSAYSTSAQFLKEVNPDYAVISVGKDNDYGFPKQVTLDKLDRLNIKVYRTDQEGTIIVSSDGDNLSFKTIKTDTNNEN